jgi:hypothetical protein
MQGAMAALTTAEVVVIAAVTGNAAIGTVTDKISSSFSGVKALPSISGDPENFEIPSYPPGTFSIRDWSGYPKGPVPQPSGPFRLLSGSEYDQARKAADQANRMMHSENPALDGLRIHEIQPVKFGGSPTDPANKIALPPSIHAQYTNWWNQLQRKLEMK